MKTRKTIWTRTLQIALAVGLTGLTVVGLRTTRSGAESSIMPTTGMSPEKAAHVAYTLSFSEKARNVVPRLPEAVPVDPPVKVPAGALDLRDGPFTPAQFHASNMWQGPANDLSWVVVFAGAVPLTPSLGRTSEVTPGVFVYTTRPDSGDPVLFGAVLPSDVSAALLRGAFTVQSFEDGVLNLSLGGSTKTYRFDTRTLLFR